MEKTNYSLCEKCDATQDECNFDRPPYPFCFRFERRTMDEIRSDRSRGIRRATAHESN
jgi:hypothetical protein